MKNNDENTSERFTYFRRSYKKEVANAFGLKTVTYSRYENGVHKIPVKVILNIADFYDTSVDYILYRTDDSKPYPIN